MFISCVYSELLRISQDRRGCSVQACQSETGRRRIMGVSSAGRRPPAPALLACKKR